MSARTPYPMIDTLRGQIVANLVMQSGVPESQIREYVARWEKGASTATTSSAPGTTGNSIDGPARASRATRKTRCRPTR